MRPAKVPATVITGFLGAGKTTLVNHLLESTRPMQIGIVVNEFGEVGIDGQLIVADESAVIEINNGCVCCTVRTDLVASVRDMLMRFGDRLERLIIETSGLADPAPVLQTFLADPDVRERVELESVVAVVDAMHARAQLHDDIAREQVVFADRIVINKTDLVSSDAVDALVAGIRRLNPTARIEYAQRSRIDAHALFGTRSFSVDNLLAIEPNLLDEDSHDHEHDDSIASCAIVVPGGIDATRFNRWINQLVQTQGTQLLRMKGVLNMHDEPRRLHFHSVHMLLDTTFGRAWMRGETRESRFVMIGRNIDAARMRDGLLSCMN
ncbi:CobW family GTP-binding protein [Caballeronia grimmiae]|uniref:Cobalamin biosynthesis protein CobW n=1 Tax=Caballeronia grimmiae TaxID=1071679 RepID=A0A069PCS9_9BURK|nr:GTP-binding protein [Caballeronia grimmiae]KDR35086.1 cobalamin biosynthesis protein CobW [Caballeronia grimmiae]GGD88937.1 cobalamin biosynthesis protein CobW [Caballeronia grimmiae]